MYKHLTPQEIEEFEKEFEYADFPINLAGTRSNIRILSFIDTLIGKRVGSVNFMQVGEIHACGHCQPDKGFALPEDFGVECTCKCHLSPDSPKRNEEHDHPSQ